MACKRIFKIAKKEGFDLSLYIDEQTYSEDQASCVLAGLREGIDPTPYCNNSFSLDKIMAIKTAIIAGVEYNELLECNDNSIEISKILNKSIAVIPEKCYENLANKIIIQAVDDLRSKNCTPKERITAKSLFTKGTKAYNYASNLTNVSLDYIKERLEREGSFR